MFSLHMLPRLCSHLHVVALLSLYFRIDAKLLSGTQHTYLRPVQTEYTKLMLKIKKERRTQLHMPRLGVIYQK